MGLLDRVLGQPSRGGLAQQLAPSVSRGVSLAARRLEPGVRPDRRTLGRAARRSAEQWNAYGSVGEIGYVCDFFGHALRRIRVFPAGVVDAEQGRIPLDECPWASQQLKADAAVALDRIRSAEHGQGEVLAQMAVNLKVAGAGNLYAALDETTGLEDWQVISTDALVWQRGSWAIKQAPDDKKPRPVDLLTDPIWQFWQRHARWPGVAYSEMDRVLGHAEGLQILERSARSRGRARIAGAGVLVMSNRYALNARRNPNGPTGGDVFDDFMAAGTAAIEDEGAVSSFMPIMLDFDVDDARKVMHHVTFDRPLTEVEEAREEKLLRRIGQGLDAPPELVTGFHDVKFANGLIIQQETYEAHVETLALAIADILGITALRSFLLAAGHPAEVVARVLVGVDPSDLIRRPNRSLDAKDAHDRLAISDATLRAELGYTDADAPEAEELLRRMAIKRGITTEALTRELLREYAEAGALASPLEVTAAEEAAQAEADAGAPALTAATQAPLGARLQRIDDDLTARLLGAAEAAVEQALTRAASRAGNRLRQTPHAAVTRHGGRGLLAALGPDGRERLALQADDLVVDDDFAQLHDQWDRWVTDAHQAAAAEVSAVTGEDVDPEPDQGFLETGWLVLVTALVTRTRTAVTGDPLTDDDLDLGETDPTAVVQPGDLRHALARAGGAQGQVTDGGAVLVDAGTRPAGGVATGEQILEAATAVGLQLTGWTWQTGAPARPFPPHQSLGGTFFTNHTAAVLRNESGQWPGNSHWHVGDHRGCRCSAEPRLELPSPN